MSVPPLQVCRRRGNRPHPHDRRLRQLRQQHLCRSVRQPKPHSQRLHLPRVTIHEGRVHVATRCGLPAEPMVNTTGVPTCQACLAGAGSDS